MDVSELADLGAYRSLRDEDPNVISDQESPRFSQTTTTNLTREHALSSSNHHPDEMIRGHERIIHWRKLGRKLLAHAPPALLVFGCVPAFLAVYPTVHFDDEPLCDPSGAFNLGYSTYNPWLIDAAFVITLPVTNGLSFSKVKLIDIAWDLGIGRGGQAAMGLMSYLVFTKSLSRIMESHSVNFGAFEAITLQHGQLSGATKMVRHFPTSQGLRAGSIFVLMVIATAFTLIFPTLASAMTGYTTSLKSYVELPDSTLVDSSFEAVRYVIHDAHRLGMNLPDDYPVTTPSWSNGKPFLLDWGQVVDRLHKDAQVSSLGDDIKNPCSWELDPVYSNFSSSWQYDQPLSDANKCDLLQSVSSYVSTYGLEGLNDTRSNFTFLGNDVRNISSPSLNISAYFSFSDTISRWDMSTRLSLSSQAASSSQNLVPSGFAWQDPRDGSYPIASTSRPLFINYNDVNSKTYYTLDELNAHGRCLQEESLYVWGFSHLLLVLCLAGLTLWFIVVYALYVDTSMSSILHANGRDLGLRRAVLDFASAMQTHLLDDDDKDCPNSYFDGNDSVNGKTKGGLISYSRLPLGRLDIDMRATRLREQWLRWW